MGPSLGSPHPVSLGHPGDVTPFSGYLSPVLCCTHRGPLLLSRRCQEPTPCPRWRGDGAAQAWGQGLELGLGEAPAQDMAVGSRRGWVLGAGSVPPAALTRAGWRAAGAEAGLSKSGFDFCRRGTHRRSLVFLLAQLPTSAAGFSAHGVGRGAGGSHTPGQLQPGRTLWVSAPGVRPHTLTPAGAAGRTWGCGQDVGLLPGQRPGLEVDLEAGEGGKSSEGDAQAWSEGLHGVAAAMSFSPQLCSLHVSQ